MNINWDLIIKIIVPLVTLILGPLLDRWLIKKPKLISYLGYVSAFTLSNEDRTQVFTHSIVVRNAGREAANNVRIGHHVLPRDYQIYPTIKHEVEPIKNNGSEIVIPKLLAGEQVTISYLYSPPLTWDKINSYTKSDEGLAKILNVIPTPQPSKWIVFLVWTLMFFGVVAIFYLIIGLLQKLFI